jgi:hypothetical protein
LWIGSSEGLHSFDGKTFKNYSTREGLPSGSVVSSLLVDNRDRLWVGTRKGLGWFDGTRFHPIDLGIRGGIGVPAMLQDRRGAVWLGLFGQGLGKLGGGKFTLYQQQNGLAHDFVTALLEDREGNIWIGTQGGGVSKFAGERFVNYTSGQGLTSGLIHAMAQDSKGNLWFGSLSDGLCRFDGKRFTKLTMEQGPSGICGRHLIDSRSCLRSRLMAAEHSEGGRFRNYTTKEGLPSNIPQSLGMTIRARGSALAFERGSPLSDGKHFTHSPIMTLIIGSVTVGGSFASNWFGRPGSDCPGGGSPQLQHKDGLGPGKVGAITKIRTAGCGSVRIPAGL